MSQLYLVGLLLEDTGPCKITAYVVLVTAASRISLRVFNASLMRLCFLPSLITYPVQQTPISPSMELRPLITALASSNPNQRMIGQLIRKLWVVNTTPKAF